MEMLILFAFILENAYLFAHGNANLLILIIHFSQMLTQMLTKMLKNYPHEGGSFG